MKVYSLPGMFASSSMGAGEGEGDKVDAGGEVRAGVSTGLVLVSVEVTAIDAVGDGVGVEMGASLFLLV